MDKQILLKKDRKDLLSSAGLIPSHHGWSVDIAPACDWNNIQFGVFYSSDVKINKKCT